MKNLKSIILLSILSIGILFINSCKEEIKPSTPSIDETEQFSPIEKRNKALSEGLIYDFAPERTEPQNQVDTRDLNLGSFTLDCTTEPDCIDGGIQFIQAFPANPNYRWRIDIIRSAGGKNLCPSITILDLNDDDWCLSDQNDITILADPVTAANLIGGGLPNVISCVPNVVYNFHYHSYHRYTFLGILSDDGTGGSSPGAFVELDLFDSNGVTNVQVFDAFDLNQDLACWNTGKCRF